MSKYFVGFKRHEVVCIIGDLPEERVKAQSLFIDLKVEFDFSGCKEVDNVLKTVDYMLLKEIVTRQGQRGKFYMIETLALAICDEVIEIAGIQKVWVAVEKGSCFVEVER